MFSPHWLTLLFESSFEFVASFSFIKSLVIHLILWSLTCVVGRIHLLLSPVSRSREAAVKCCTFVVVSLMCFCICGICVLSYGFSPLFFLFVSSLVLLSSFGYMLGKLTAVATVMVDTAPSISCQRHFALPKTCALHHALLLGGNRAELENVVYLLTLLFYFVFRARGISVQ